MRQTSDSSAFRRIVRRAQMLRRRWSRRLKM